MKRLLFPLLLMLLVTGLGTGCTVDEWAPHQEVEPPPPAPPLPCNGDPALCGLRYDQLTYATSHLSFNAELGKGGFAWPNQKYGIDRQLRDGIRGLWIKAYDLNGTLTCYHGPELSTAISGSRPLNLVLQEIHDWMVANPREVVTLIIESPLDGPTFADAFAAVGLDSLVYDQDPTAPWDRLEDMIESVGRLVVLTRNDAAAGTPRWFLPYNDYVSETQDTVDAIEDLGPETLWDPSWGLFMINHFVDAPLLGVLEDRQADPDIAAQINEFDFLWERVKECQDWYSRWPTYIAVDYYDRGDVVRVANIINGIEEF